MSILMRRFVTTTPGLVVCTVIGVLGMVASLLTDLPRWQQLPGLGFFLGIAIAAGGRLAGQLRPRRFGWIRRISMPVGLTTIGTSILGAGVLMVVTGEGATEGSDPLLIGIGAIALGLVMTLLGVGAVFAVTRPRPGGCPTDKVSGGTE